MVCIQGEIKGASPGYPDSRHFAHRNNDTGLTRFPRCMRTLHTVVYQMLENKEDADAVVRACSADALSHAEAAITEGEMCSCLLRIAVDRALQIRERQADGSLRAPALESI